MGYRVASLRNSIFEGDALGTLALMPSGSIDLILCDLPYGTTQNHWDSVIPLDQLWEQYDRVLKVDGAVLLTSQGLFTSLLTMSNIKNFKYKIVWVKSKATNFLNVRRQPLRRHEDICVFYRKQPTYNPQMTPGEAYDKGMRKSQLSGSYGDFGSVHVKSEGDRYPTDVVYFKTAESEGKVTHPTQKPVELARYLIRTFSNPGDLVLDSTFGSGSFLVAAAMENRDFVGVELNENAVSFKDVETDWIDVAKQRLLSAGVNVNVYRAGEFDVNTRIQ